MCSSRVGRIPAAMRMLRRCSTVFPGGSSSSVWWVMARPASSRSIWGAELLSSQALSVSWPLGRGQHPVEDFPVGRDGAGVVGEQVVQAPGDRAASAPPVVEPSGLAAAGATAPGVVGPGAQRAQRLVEGSAAQRSDLAAPGAADPALLARQAPGLVGGLGDHARCGPPADRARQDGVRYALATERSVGCANRRPVDVDRRRRMFRGWRDR